MSYLEQRRNEKLFGKQPQEKKQYRIPAKSAKKIAEEKVEKENFADGGMSALDKWFEERRREMTGVCLFCSGKTEKDNDETYRRSIAHLLAKRKAMFPSVATHPENWIELCHFGNSCHDNFDRAMITWEILRDSKEWEVIVEKFKRVYPFIAEKERKNIPEILLQTLKLKT